MATGGKEGVVALHLSFRHNLALMRSLAEAISKLFPSNFFASCIDSFSDVGFLTTFHNMHLISSIIKQIGQSYYSMNSCISFSKFFKQ